MASALFRHIFNKSHELIIIYKDGDDAMLHPILTTKLFVPKILSNFVIRKSLVDKLIYGINTKSKLTLVSAPAGYGKTTLILELLNSINLANA